jgi:phage shock protein A
MARRTVISQLASAGEEALEQLAQNPVTRRALESALMLKDRVERVVAGLSDVDGRVAKLEKRVEALEKKAKPTTATTSKPRAATATTKKPAA